MAAERRVFLVLLYAVFLHFLPPSRVSHSFLAWCPVNVKWPGVVFVCSLVSSSILFFVLPPPSLLSDFNHVWCSQNLLARWFSVLYYFGKDSQSLVSNISFLHLLPHFIFPVPSSSSVPPFSLLSWHVPQGFILDPQSFHFLCPVSHILSGKFESPTTKSRPKQVLPCMRRGENHGYCPAWGKEKTMGAVLHGGRRDPWVQEIPMDVSLHGCRRDPQMLLCMVDRRDPWVLQWGLRLWDLVTGASYGCGWVQRSGLALLPFLGLAASKSALGILAWISVSQDLSSQTGGKLIMIWKDRKCYLSLIHFCPGVISLGFYCSLG